MNVLRLIMDIGSNVTLNLSGNILTTVKAFRTCLIQYVANMINDTT